MNTKLSLITLFACATAGTALFADNENYDGQDLSGQTLSSYDDPKSYANSSWIGANLADASLSYATLTDANFADAEIKGANFSDSTLTLSQLCSTASYKTKDLSGVGLGEGIFYGVLNHVSLNLGEGDFSGVNLTNASLERAILTNADFAGANLMNASLASARLDGAEFTDSVINGASFVNTALTLSQLYSTASYKAKDLSGVSFGGDLSGANFEGIDMTGANLRGTTLTDADFTNAVIAGAKISTSTLTLSQLYSTASYKTKDLSGIDLQRASLIGANFSGVNLSGANLILAQLTDADLTNTNLSSAILGWSNFSNATLTNANFENATFGATVGVTVAPTIGNPPGSVYFYGADLTGANFTKAEITLGDFSTDSTYGTANLTNAVFTGATITSSSFTGATLTNADFENAKVGDSSGSVSFNGADLTGANFTKATITSVSYFDGATLTGANFENAVIGDSSGYVYFKGADLTGANFTKAEITNCNFSTDSTYGTTNLTDAVFTGVTITGSSFYGATLTGANFENAVIGATSGYVYFKGADLTGANFTKAEITKTYFGQQQWSIIGSETPATMENAVFAGATITDSYFNGATLTGANFENAVIGDSGNLYVYFNGADLTDANFTKASLSNVCLDSATLKGANFTGADLYVSSATGADLTNTIFDDAKVCGFYGSFNGINATGASFKNTTFSFFDFSSTETSGTTILRGVDFSECTFTNTGFFDGADLTGASFSNLSLGIWDGHKIVDEVSFDGANLTRANLSGSCIQTSFSNTNFTDTVFTNAKVCSLAPFSGATLVRTDFRGSSGLDVDSVLQNAGTVKNMLGTDGYIHGFTMESAEDSFTVSVHVPVEGAKSIGAVVGSEVISGGAELTIGAGSSLSIEKSLSVETGSALILGAGTELRFDWISDTSAYSQLSILDGGSLKFSSDTKIIIGASGVDSLSGSFTLITWADGLTKPDWGDLTKGGKIVLYSDADGNTYADELWDFSTEGNALTIKIYSGSVDPETEITINGIDQVVTLPGTEYVGTFDALLTEFRGTISGEGSIHSGYDLTFAGDASEHTGTTYIDGGTFTIVDAAKLGTGAFEVASAGTLRIEGTRDFSNELSGAGALTSAGTITLSGDASAHTGTTKVESGTLTIAETATLGTGDFEIAGTLVLNGTRTFKNATSGSGMLKVASGTMTFTKNVGTAKLEISENTEAKFAGTSDGFAGALTGSGALTTMQNFTLSGNASDFAGTTNVESGTLTVAETAKLGTGAFDVSGTLALNGDRDFTNTLSGTGKLSVNGNVNFSANTDEFAGTLAVDGGTVTVAQGTTLDVAGTLSVVNGATLKLFGGDSLGAAVEVASGAAVSFADGAKLIVEVSTGQQVGFKTSVMIWETDSSISGLSGLKKNTNISFIVNGLELSVDAWGFEVGTTGLTVYTLGGTTIISECDKDIVLDHEISATFDPNLTEYTGKISGDGDVHSTGTLTFAGDASAHTGTTYIDGGTFTIVDEATLGTGAFEVASAGTLRIEGTRDFSNELSGAGTLTTAGTITLSGDASGFSGTTKVESGTLTIAETATLGTGAFEIAGTLALNGNRTFNNATSGSGKIEVSTGTTTFAKNIGVKTLSVSQDATATLADGVGLTHTDANVALAGTLDLKGNRDFATTLSGAGKLTTDGNVNFTSDASGFTGKTSVNAGTFTVAESAKLGTSAFDVAGTLALNGDRTFANTTSGNGTISVASGASVAFTKNVGVKKLSIADGAMLRGNVKLTHGADAALELAGTLVLDAAAGEKVSLGGGKVVIKSTAELDLSGTSSAAISSTSAVVYDAASTESALLSGARVTIFESGTVSGADVVSFLSSDTTLSDLATRYAVVYDVSSGLSVRVLSSGTVDTSIVDTQGLSASFVDWALGNVASASLSTGIYSESEIPSADDPLANALLAGDAGTARAILDRLSPKSYAAMIAMPVETFHDDVRSISARLEQRRYDATVRRGLSWEFFAQAQMISVDNDTSKSAPTFDFDRYGVLAGADVKLDPTLLVGVALGAGTGEAKIHNGGGKIESDDYRLNVFGGKTFAERFYVNAGAQLGFASYDVKRKTDYGNANASADGWNAGAFAETGVVLTISDEYKLYAMPYLGLAYTHAATDSFKESGSDAAFDADSLAGDSLRARLGCSFSWRFDVAGARWRVGLDVAYSHELLDDEIDIDVKATDDGSKISETAKALPEDVFSIGPSVNVDLTSSSSIYAGYTFNAGTDSATAHNANIGFRMRF